MLLTAVAFIALVGSENATSADPRLSATPAPSGGTATSTASPTAPNLGQPQSATSTSTSTPTSTPSSGLATSISKFTDAGWGGTTADVGGAVVLNDQTVAPPTFLQKTTPANQLPHRYGFYELSATAPAPVTQYHLSWTQETPAGSKVVMLTGALDYGSSGPNLLPKVSVNGTSADVTLPKPAAKIYITFQLYSGIGSAATDIGASPRVTGLAVSSVGSPNLILAPLLAPQQWLNAGTQAIRGQAAPAASLMHPVGTLVTPVPTP